MEDLEEVEEVAARSRWRLRTLRQCMLAGIGMFTESYFIFTTGQVHGIWKAGYPECWAPEEDALCLDNSVCPDVFGNSSEDVDTPDCAQVVCSSATRNVLSGAEFIGIMVGMLLFSYLADRVGRRIGSVMVSSIMLIGAFGMVFTPFGSASSSAMFTSFIVAFGILGLGIGGEYPLSSVGATERAGEDLSPDLRGSYVVMVFSMQGLGAIVGSAVLLVGVLFTRAGKTNCDAKGANAFGYSVATLAMIWRGVYAIGTLVLLFAIVYRLFFVKETQVFEESKNHTGIPVVVKLYRLLTMYLPRFVGTAGCWLLWDICFYGNKLFISNIVSSLHEGDESLGAEQSYILLNNIVALFGYLLAAVLIDRVGRRALQLFGFAALAVIFLLVGLFYPLLHHRFGVVFGLYLLTSFFGQLGPNATTYLLPAESFPTEVRSIAHGLSAFSGKAGALIGTTVFATVSTKTIFLICGVVSAAGAFATLLLTVNLSRLNLEEIDRWHEQRVEGQPISSDAGHPSRLSLVERRFGLGANRSSVYEGVEDLD